MENSFTAIGTSVLVGSAVGGAYGIFDGIRQTSNLEGKLRRTQIVNYTLKSGKCKACFSTGSTELADFKSVFLYSFQNQIKIRRSFKSQDFSQTPLKFSDPLKLFYKIRPKFLSAIS